MQHKKRSPYEKSSDSEASSESEAETTVSDTQASEAPTTVTQSTTREIPDDLAKRYSGRSRRSKLYLQCYQNGWDKAFKDSNTAKMVKFLNEAGIEPSPKLEMTEKQALHTARMREFAARLRAEKMPHKAKPKSKRVHETDPDQLNTQLSKLTKRISKIQSIIPQRPPKIEAVINKRKQLFAEVVEDVKEVPIPKELPIIKPKREPVRAVEIDLPVLEPKRQEAIRKHHRRKIIKWEEAPSEVPSEASTLDLSADIALLKKYMH